MSEVKEKQIRSILKSLSWRVLASLFTIIVSYWIIGDLGKATQIGIIEFFGKLLLYYFHERAWSKSKIGLKVEQKRDYQI